MRVRVRVGHLGRGEEEVAAAEQGELAARLHAQRRVVLRRRLRETAQRLVRVRARVRLRLRERVRVRVRVRVGVRD